MAEGYAGAREVAKTIENLWGWDVMDPKMVDDAMWDEFKLEAANVQTAQEALNLNWKYAPDELSRLYVRGSLLTYKQWTDSRATDQITDSNEAELGYSRLLGTQHWNIKWALTGCTPILI
jgi:hypothetical protein